jgi:hypothetical protein
MDIVVDVGMLRRMQHSRKSHRHVDLEHLLSLQAFLQDLLAFLPELLAFLPELLAFLQELLALRRELQASP